MSSTNDVSMSNQRLDWDALVHNCMECIPFLEVREENLSGISHCIQYQSVLYGQLFYNLCIQEEVDARH